MTAAVICEFNPFHNGHAFLLDEARRMGADRLVAVMSGNFVQRGEPAIFDSRKRTETALKAGVNLVLQLPVAYATAGAEKFARGAVNILNACGNIDELIFGSECGDIDKLCKIADILISGEADGKIGELMDTGLTYAVARERAVESVAPDISGLLSGSNNILGIEYIIALKRSNSKIIPKTVKRQGAEHNSAAALDGFASATEIRRRIMAGEGTDDFVPGFAEYEKNKPVDYDKYSAVALYKIGTSSAGELKELPDVSEGLENRIKECFQNAKTVDELYDLIKTKRYTHSRIRRIILSAVLGIKAEDVSAKPEYIKINGFDETGRKMLSEMKNTALLPVVTKPGDLSSLGEKAQKMFSLECKAADIYSILSDDEQGKEKLPPIYFERKEQ